MTERDRRDYIGGSDIPALVLGHHYSVTPYTAWLVKTRQVEPPVVSGPDISRGVALQSTALDLAQDLPDTQYGDEVWVEGPEPWAAGHVDRLGVGWVAEAKCPRAHNYRRLRQEPAAAHLLQLQYYLWLTGSERGYLVYFCADSWETTTIEVLASAEVQDIIVARCQAFWGHVQDRTPTDLPPLLELEQRLRGRNLQRAVTASPEMSALAFRARRLDQEIKEREGALSQVREEIIRIWPEDARSVSVLYVGSLAWVAGSTRTTVDTRALRASHPELVAEHMRETVSKPSIRMTWEKNDE